MGTRFQAAVLDGPGRPLTIESVEAGALMPDDVLVRVAAAGLCHTDLEVISGQLAYPGPIVLGHEAAGRIEAVGPGVARSRIGQKVILSWNPHCGRCFYCDTGQPILCETYISQGPRALPFDGRPRLFLDGRPIHTMFYIAGFAQYAVVASDCAVAIPDVMPLDRACLIGCGVMTGVGAAINSGAVRPGQTVLVIGCGAVGLSAIQGARLAGAQNIVAADLDDKKLDLARCLGATHVVNPKLSDAVLLLRDLTAGRGADCVLEAAGNQPAFRLSAEACRPGGRIVWLGKTGVNDEVAFRWGALMGEKQIVRSSYGGARPQRDFPWLCQSYLDGRLLLDELITDRITLEDINEGFERLAAGQAVRTVVVLDDVS